MSRLVVVLKGQDEGGKGTQSRRVLAGEAWSLASNLQAGQRGPPARNAKDGPGGEVA